MNNLHLLSLLLFSFLSTSAYCQLYKAEYIFIKENDTYRQIDTTAYLDYNLKEKYVELVFKDSIYHYLIKKRGAKPDDEERFVVWFKGTPDTMLWNLKGDEYFFIFKIGHKFYYFRNLSESTKEEISAHKKSLFEAK